MAVYPELVIPTAKTFVRLLVACILLSVTLAAAAQARFSTPQAATDAFVDAIATGDDDALARVLGADYKARIPQHDYQDEIPSFLGAWSRQHQVITDDSGRAWLEVGATHWRLPIPVVQSGGGWRFDTAAGAAEMRKRQLGRNELGAIETLRLLHGAQQAYLQRQGNYAQRLVSRSGAHDGLYWPSQDGSDASPLGADALAMTPDTPADASYFGYRFKIMPASGTSGFSIIAWPAVHGVTGIHTFMVSEDAVIRQSSAQTAAQAVKIPWSEWRPLDEQ